MCEGIWRNRTGQRVVITRCEPVGGQQWTDGCEFYSDDGRYYQSEREDSQDLVTFVGLLPDKSQRAPVSRPAETESTTAVAGGVSDDPGRIIHNLEQRLEAAKNRNSQALNQLVERDQAINEKSAEIARLRTELQQTEAWRTAATDAHSQSETLRIEQATEIERLQAELRGYAAESHRQLRARQAEHDKATATLRAEQRGAQQAYLAAIKTFLEASR